MLDQMSVVEAKKEISLSCLATFSLMAVYNAGMAVLEKCDWLGISYLGSNLLKPSPYTLVVHLWQ